MLIAQVLNFSGLLPAGLARKANINEGTISRWRSGKQKIDRGYLYILYYTFENNSMIKNMLKSELY